jgi:hypothetical protein
VLLPAVPQRWESLESLRQCHGGQEVRRIQSLVLELLQTSLRQWKVATRMPLPPAHLAGPPGSVLLVLDNSQAISFRRLEGGGCFRVKIPKVRVQRLAPVTSKPLSKLRLRLRI